MTEATGDAVGVGIAALTAATAGDGGAVATIQLTPPATRPATASTAAPVRSRRMAAARW
jgi:hypothetical protein